MSGQGASESRECASSSSNSQQECFINYKYQSLLMWSLRCHIALVVLIVPGIDVLKTPMGNASMAVDM
jgi:hypothetical protein